MALLLVCSGGGALFFAGNEILLFVSDRRRGGVLRLFVLGFLGSCLAVVFGLFRCCFWIVFVLLVRWDYWVDLGSGLTGKRVVLGGSLVGFGCGFTTRFWGGEGGVCWLFAGERRGVWVCFWLGFWWWEELFVASFWSDETTGERDCDQGGERRPFLGGENGRGKN
ncbi:hypothetical protein AABB24_027874 [Solanum stoloniferum]|uniref:Transmembrane protein n=1 Tax=Solanum stoloniferum TaxID=62892 RepID=A0ABD2S504_9SOLN